MKKILTLLALCCLVVTGAWAQASADTQAAAAEEVINDFMGTGSGLTVNVTIDPSMKVNGKDKFTYTLNGSTLNITASNGVAACRGFYDFTKSNGAGICSWSANRFKAPASPTTTTKTVTSPYRDHQYLNVVTYGYSMPYWDENRWDKEIAWMALHGIDMPLMLVGSENIYRQVFKNLYHVSDADIDAWEVGPANLPWMRMGNLSGTSFDGPLGQHWRTRQEALAKHILQKMGELGMRPIVPAFGGFIPKAVADIIQNNGGSYSKTGWDWVLNTYPNYRLTPIAGTGGQDGDFKKIGKEFIRLWDETFEESYGSPFKYYLSDSFNEMAVPSDPTTLRSYGTEIYNAIKEGSGNNDAVWVTQGWEFIYGSGKWTDGTSSDQKFRDLTSSVPDHNFMVLSMSPEYGGYNNKKWEAYSNYCGKEWINTMLPNMGGKNFWTGKLQDYATTFPNTLWNSNGSQNCTGWGITAEGIEYNEMLYELIADMGWEPNHTKDLDNWVLEYGNARYGSDKYSDKFKALHTTLRNTVYSSYIDHQNFGWQGNGKSNGYYNSGNINTTNDTFFQGFETFFGEEHMGELKTIAENGGLDETMRADLIEFSAFYAAARVEKICKRITTANNTGNKALANELIAELDKVMTDMDYILTGHPIYDEAKWEQKARTLAGGNADAEKKYVKNARRIVTTWFGNHQGHEAVNDYASRIYAGIIRDYYLPRLKAELNQLVNGTACNLRDIERTFTPNGDVDIDAPALSAPGYYLGSDEKTTVPEGITSSTSDAVLLANIQALVEEAQEAGQIIIEKNKLTVSTDAESHWYLVNSNNPAYTDRSLTATGVDGAKSTVKAQTTEATNEQIWRFVDNHDGTVRMENRNGQTLTWESGAAKTYIASINAGMTYELDEANTRYALMPKSMTSGKALHMNSNDGVPIEYGYKDAGTTNYWSGSTWTLSNADGYIGVPSDEDFARITRRFQGFQTSVWGTGSYGSVGQPKSANALQAAITAVATRDLALDTYTDYLATYDEALKTNFTLPTDAEALKLFDLIISAFQIDPSINCNTEDQATFKAALQAAQTALAGNATGNTATTAATTLEAAVKAFISNAASFPYISKAPANGQFDENSKVITMKVKKSGYITTAAVDGSGNFTLGNSTAPTTNAGYWIVSGNDTQGYTFYNVGAGATKVLGMTGSEAGARAKLYDASSTSGVTTKFFYKKNQNGEHCFYISGNNAWNDRGSYLALWNDAKAFETDNGSAIIIALVETETPQPAEGDWTASDWTACSTAQTTNFKSAAYYDAKQITIGSAASTRRQVRAKAAEQGTNTVTVTIKFSRGTHAQALYGVQLLNEDGTVAYETSYELTTLVTAATKTYTLNNVADGTYTVRIWSAATKGDETMTATGTVEVTINSTKDGETLNWNNTNWNIENTAVPAAVQNLAPSVGITLNEGNGGTRTYYYMDKQMTFNKATTLTTTITNNDNTTDLDLIGVELLKSGTLVTTEGTYDGHYSDSETNNTYTVQVPEAGDYTVRTWASYVPAKVPASGGAQYVAGEQVDDIRTVINYGNLPTTGVSNPDSQWEAWEGEVPQSISTQGDYNTAEDLYVIEKHYTFTNEYNKLQVTFQHDGGSHRTDIVGVGVIAADGTVYSDYHFGFTGNAKECNVYAINGIPAGTYTVRYVTTKHRGSEKNTLIKGTITNVVSEGFVPLTFVSEIKDGATYAFVNIQPTSPRKTYYVQSNGNNIVSPAPSADACSADFEWPESAQFVAEVQSNGNYAFKNVATNKYLAYKRLDDNVDANLSTWSVTDGTRPCFSDIHTFWFGVNKRTSSSNSDGTLIFDNNGNIGDCSKIEFKANVSNSNNYGLVLVKDAAVTSVEVPYTLTPTDGATITSIDDLATITLQFTGEDVEEGLMPMTAEDMEKEPVYPTLTKGSTIITATSIAMNDDTGFYDITFPTTDITDGEWKLCIPEGAFYTMDWLTLAELVVAEITATYTVASVVPADVIATLTINGVETNYNEGDDIVLKDGEAGLTKVVIPNDVDNVDVTYTREFKNTNSQPWYVPFEITVPDGFTFYKIWNLEVDESTGVATAVVSKELSSGETIKANTPYIVKANNAGTYNFNSNALKATVEGEANNKTWCATTELMYHFYGSYTSFDLSSKPCYYMSTGTFYYATSTTTLRPYRFYLVVAAKKTDTPIWPADLENAGAGSKLQIITLGDEEDEPTGIGTVIAPSKNDIHFDLMGRKVNGNVSGLQIVNGEKILVK